MSIMADSLSLDDAPAADWRAGRLRLRLLGHGDADLYRATYTDAVLMRRVGQPLSTTRADASFGAAMAENSRQPWRRLTWVLHGHVSTDPIGLLGVMREPDDAARAEIGVIIQRHWQGRGLATEALRALVARCLSTPSLATVLIRHHPDHAAVLAMATALGFGEVLDRGTGDWRLWSRSTSGSA